MLKLFGGKADHPLADPKEARKLLEETAADDSLKALDELGHWFESVGATEGFKPDYRAQLVLQIDEAAQSHLRKLSREYLSSARLSKFQENRLWTAIHGYWERCGAAFAACVAFYDSGAKGADALKTSVALLGSRALRAFGQQMKWQYLRYGPFDNSIWGRAAKVYLQSEARGLLGRKVTVYPAVPGESTAEYEFVRIAMLAASSPDGLLPVEIELAERLIAHFAPSFSLFPKQEAEAAYWIDLAASQPPLRLAKPPQPSATVRFLSAGKAMQEAQALMDRVKTSNAVPSSVNLGGAYEPAMVQDVLEHLSMYWSTQPPERKHLRHRVKTRLAVVHGLEGVLAALGGSQSLDFGATEAESWIVDNVSAGGFGALVPQIQGEWLKIGCLLGLQPEGGDNWLLGVVRRFNRDTPKQGSVGIQTLARATQTVEFQIGAAAETGLLLDPQGIETASEAHVLLKSGVYIPGQNIEFEQGGKHVFLLPLGPAETGDDYEILRCRPMLRDKGE